MLKAAELEKLGIFMSKKQDFKNILKDLGLTASQQAKLKSQLSKFKLTNKKGNPHLKKGGKAKK